VLPQAVLQQHGLQEISAPGAVTHAGVTTLFVPNATARAARGVTLEAESSAGPDAAGGTTYDFPIASLVLPASGARLIRCVVCSVHLSPFAKSAEKRAAQLERVTAAMVDLNRKLGDARHPDVSTVVKPSANPAKKGTAAKTAKGALVTHTMFIIAGDMNMRDEEGHPWPTAKAGGKIAFADAFCAFETSRPDLAYAHKHTWDTGIAYNGPNGARGAYTARYDRAFVAAVSNGSGTAAPTTVPESWELVGQTPYVCGTWDGLHADIPTDFFSAWKPGADAASARGKEPAGESEKQKKAACLSKMLLAADAAVAAGELVLSDSPGSSVPAPRYLSDHFGFAMSLRL
jgi:endonuclease/exonuclease/phosphatase family metal-dependent hydrolase